MSKCGHNARASQVHFHTTGGTSYANKRADYCDEHGEEMTLMQLFEDGHKRKDGTFIEGSVTKDFLEDVEAGVELLKQMNPSSDKSHHEFENEAFDRVMYGDEIPSRPQGFGFRVRKSSIYGVNGILRKEGYGKSHKRPVLVDDELKAEVSSLSKRNVVLENQNQDLQSKAEEHSNLLRELVDIVRTGKASPQLLDSAKSTLYMTKMKDNDRDGKSA